MCACRRLDAVHAAADLRESGAPVPLSPASTSAPRLLPAVMDDTMFHHAQFALTVG